MKKIFIACCICLISCSSTAQSNSTDSLIKRLAVTSKPIERFDLMNQILENNTRNQERRNDSTYRIQMYEIAQKLNNDSLLAITYNVLGQLMMNKADYPAALKYYFTAIPLAEKAKDKRRLSSLYFDITVIYLTLQNNEDAIKYNRLGGENLPDRSSAIYDFMASQYYRNMVSYFLQTNHADSALKYTHDLEEVTQRLKSPLLDVQMLSSYGLTYAQLGDKEMASLYFKKANILADSISSVQQAMLAKRYYISFLLSNNDFVEARRQAFSLLELSTEANNVARKLQAAGYLKTIYQNIKNIDSAYYYLSMESALKDSIYTQENFNKIQNLAFTEQIRKIDEEAKQASAEEQRKQNIQYALLALGIIIFIIAFLLLSRRHITNTKIIQFLGVLALLLVFEFLNLLLHPFLEKITHHNPILMLLALVCIAALLVPLHHKLEKWATHKLVEKNKAIRLASAKKTIEQLDSK